MSRVLQLTSDWKWTGPAAPMLDLLLAQRARGHAVELACPGAAPGESEALAERARRAGVEPVLALSRARGAIWWRDRHDARQLARLLRERRFDVVHTWHTRDHVLAVRAAAPQRRAGATRIVRSFSRAERIPPWPWHRWLFGSATDGLLCVSPETARRNAPVRGGRPVLGAFGAVDLARFAPRRPAPGLREGLGLSPEHRVVGIAARVQPHRRFDLLLEAAARLCRADDRARLLVVGRGTHLEETARRPARELGLSERVVFAGYRGDDYPDVLRAMDVFTYLVPGSDGGCRALLEAAACGLPAVTSRRGALPELVENGETGLLVDEEPEALCAAWRELLGDEVRRARMGEAARARAERCFAPECLAEAVDRLYAACLPPGTR